MKIFQHKLQTVKMTQPIVKTVLFILLISVALTSCNNKKDASGDDEKEKVADAEHSFNITLVKGSETIEYSGAVPINEGGALYNEQKSPRGEQGDRDRTITMIIGKDYNRGEAGIFGLFRVDENWKPITDIKHALKNASNLTIRPNEKGDYYSGISGTLTFSDLKFVLPMPNNGAASFTLDFEGDFQKNSSKEEIFHGSGTIVLSPKRKMGVYKKK